MDDYTTLHCNIEAVLIEGFHSIRKRIFKIASLYLCSALLLEREERDILLTRVD
jgi:hypothetical protein